MRKLLPKPSPTPVVQRIPITKARMNLGELAKRAHVNGEYFILEKDGIPVIGIMDADELEDYLELKNPQVLAQIAASKADVQAGRIKPAENLLAGLKTPSAAQAPRSRRRA